MTDDEIIKALNSNGTSTGVALGHHSGKADIIADRFRELIGENKRQKAEIERLQKHNLVVARKHYDDGIKEFAVQLKKQVSKQNSFDFEDVDNLVKEMTENDFKE